MKIVQVIPQGQNSILAIGGVSTIMELAKSYGFSIEYQMLSAQTSKEIKLNQFSLRAHCIIHTNIKADLIIIPSIIEHPDKVLLENHHLIKWLLRMRKKGSRLASLCTGAYLLAETGLLDGQEASSHCNAISDLQLRYPQVKWMPDKIITDHNGIYTSGGTLSSFNLLIYILGKYFDKALSIRIAKMIQLDYPRLSQKPFYIFSNQKNHRDGQILAVQEYLESHLEETINLEKLAHDFGMSRRSFNRRFKLATGVNPKYYIQKTKIEQAKQWLESNQYSVKEVLYKIGYNDEHSFRTLFKKMTGLLPNEYKKKYAH